MTGPPQFGPNAGSPTVGLAARVLWLIAAVAVIASVLVYLPALGRFRDEWLRNRLSAAETAALVLEAAPRDRVPQGLTRALLDHVGARVIVLKTATTTRLLAASDMPPAIDVTYDLRAPGMGGAILAALGTIVQRGDRVLNVIGAAPSAEDLLMVTVDEAPLRSAMLRFSADFLSATAFVAASVGMLTLFALHAMVLGPVGRLTSSLVTFALDPQDETRVIAPSSAGHELGVAERALAALQGALVRQLAEKQRLAALGLAVAKINHDLRNMLTPAQLLSDRLAEVADPVAQRLAPKLMGTLDRAIAFCQSTLAYGSAAERAPQPQRIELSLLVRDVFEAVSPEPQDGLSLVNGVRPGTDVGADPEQLFRILLNLVRNGAEAIRRGEAGHGRVTVSADILGGGVAIRVADDGPGIAPAIEARLFSAFQGSSRAGGHGLGLAIAADLARGHGGSVTLERTGHAARGATFLVNLPRAAPSVTMVLAKPGVSG